MDGEGKQGKPPGTLRVPRERGKEKTNTLTRKKPK